MTRVRLIVVAMLAVLAVTAISASGASAFTKFTAAEKTKVTTKGGEQILTATEESAPKTAVVTKCKEFSGTGEVVKGQTEIKGTGKYGGCTVAGLAATVTTTCSTDIHINGEVDIEALPEKCEEKIAVATTKCTITIVTPQKSLKEVKFTKGAGAAFSSEAAVGGIKFESATGKACGFATATTKGTASYSGKQENTGTNVE